MEALEDVQRLNGGYLTPATLRTLAAELGVPIYRLHGVATFYPHFRLAPPPTRDVRVCTDLSCRLRGGEALVHDVEAAAHARPAGEVTVERVSCLGRCDGAPALTVNDTPYWRLDAGARDALIRALRAVSTERGRDPRRFVLFAFGGMGPVQALDVAVELGITKVVIPPLPGLFSSLGLLFAGVEHHLIRTHYADAARLDFNRTNRVIAELATEARTTLAREGYDPAHQAIALAADTRYAGQDYALPIPLRTERLTPALLAQLVADFHQEHEKTYGYRSEKEPVQIVAFRSVARGLSDTAHVPDRLEIKASQGWRPSPARNCYFGPRHGWIKTDVIARADLGSRAIAGPAIIEEAASVTVLNSGQVIDVDRFGNLAISRVR